MVQDKMMIDSIQEEKKLIEFKRIVADLGQNEKTCLRFLRARNYDLNKAEEMIRKAIEWRKTYQVDLWESWVMPEPIVGEFNWGKLGLDNDGRPVIYLPIGAWKIREFLEDGWKEEMHRNIIVVLETIMKWIRESEMDQFYCIVDVATLSYHKVAHYETVQMILQVFRNFESSYPETLFKSAVLNAPWVFSYIFALTKPLISGDTMSKITVFDEDTNKWREALLKDMPKETVPDPPRPRVRSYNYIRKGKKQ